jgi:hypothetical protein
LALNVRRGHDHWAEYICEDYYIWLDGYTPVPNLRGKTQIKEFDSLPTLEQLPLWGFDGSSTMQAEGHSSDCVLKPVRVFPDAARTNGVLLMCDDARRQNSALLQQARHDIGHPHHAIEAFGFDPHESSGLCAAREKRALLLKSLTVQRDRSLWLSPLTDESS